MKVCVVSKVFSYSEEDPDSEVVSKVFSYSEEDPDSEVVSVFSSESLAQSAIMNYNECFKTDPSVSFDCEEFDVI